jgi:hypothetical protein
MAQRVALMIALTFVWNISGLGQTTKTLASLNSVTLSAFSYFQQVEGHGFDDYLRRIRPAALTPDLRVRVLNMLPSADLVNPRADWLAKLKTLNPILNYHERLSVIEIKVLRLPDKPSRDDHSGSLTKFATAMFLAGTAVLITEPALEILTAEELQAVVAHELGHEYYWNQFDRASRNKQYAELQELELRCDGIAVVTLLHVGVDPESLISAITKLNKHNLQQSQSSSKNYVAFSERSAFIRLVTELVKTNTLNHRKDASQDFGGGLTRLNNSL